ncbi:MAG: calycin-like domain-containing protein [Paludibacter sp.]|jgi:hypothetical protein|nr:calycin-like domain-containing protein [Paludibacter sp.]
MKNFKFLAILFLATSVAMVSCDNTPEPDPDPVKPAVAGKTYIGTTLLTMGPSTTTLENIVVQILETEYTDTVQVVLKKVKFATAMPEIDITIPSVFAKKAGNGYELSANDVIPTAMGGVPAPNYIITDLTGNATETTLALTMKAGSLPLAYEGVVIAVE